jgi:hypothetical protein
MVRRTLLAALLALGLAAAACQPTDRDMTPIPNADGRTDAPLNDEAVGPNESQDEIDDEGP